MAQNANSTDRVVYPSAMDITETGGYNGLPHLSGVFRVASDVKDDQFQNSNTGQIQNCVKFRVPIQKRSATINKITQKLWGVNVRPEGEETTWMGCNAYGFLADNLKKRGLKKGDLVFIAGDLTFDPEDKNPGCAFVNLKLTSASVLPSGNSQRQGGTQTASNQTTNTTMGATTQTAGTPNPFVGNAAPGNPFATGQALVNNAAPASNPFATGQAPVNNAAPASNPFATGQAPVNNAAPASNPFATGQTPVNNMVPASNPVVENTAPAGNPFGGNTAPVGNPFGGNTAPAGNPFGGNVGMAQTPFDVAQ